MRLDIHVLVQDANDLNLPGLEMSVKHDVYTNWVFEITLT